jgi:hypothetical protein
VKAAGSASKNSWNTNTQQSLSTNIGLNPRR